ncbi:hypothetical protein BDZ94DRAFT_546417 [Collybia nuda]|uniref:Uncharacterized protein n=1 Tax=Collybia nuda TaxID=64659 RepID=A0A9P5YH35_9AGAR|nr:hypothetical protein BDZ94DRAFT_546417 [Collybia nuda]
MHGSPFVLDWVFVLAESVDGSPKIHNVSVRQNEEGALAINRPPTRKRLLIYVGQTYAQKSLQSLGNVDRAVSRELCPQGESRFNRHKIVCYQRVEPGNAMGFSRESPEGYWPKGFGVRNCHEETCKGKGVQKVEAADVQTQAP